MSTVNGLPDTYGGTMTCVLNDKYINVVARNIVMLLIAAQLPPAEAAEVILHVWYSARLIRGMLTVIDDYVRKVRLLPHFVDFTFSKNLRVDPCTACCRCSLQNQRQIRQSPPVQKLDLRSRRHHPTPDQIAVEDCARNHRREARPLKDGGRATKSGPDAASTRLP